MRHSQHRSPDPLVRLSIFRSAALTRANPGAVALSGTYVSFQFLVTQYLQILGHWSAMGTVLAFLPGGVMVALLSPRMGPATSRFGPARIAVAAFCCLTAGYAVFPRAGPRPGYPGVMLPAMILIGLAFGLGFTALSLAATAGVADAEQGLAASLFQAAFQVGGAVVLSVVAAVIDARGANRVLSAQATMGAYRPALILLTVVAGAGTVIAVTGLRPPRRRVGQPAPQARPGLRAPEAAAGA